MEYYEEFHLRLDKFHQRYGRLPERDFLKACPDPFLVFDLLGPLPRDFDAYASTSTAGDPTILGDIEETEMGRILVAPLVKSDRNDAQGMITVGRAPHNDIVIPHRSVSKFHAFLERTRGGAFRIQDAKSAFGTAVNGETLEPGVACALKSGDQILFSGFVGGNYLSPLRFYQYMIRVAIKGKGPGPPGS